MIIGEVLAKKYYIFINFIMSCFEILNNKSDIFIYLYRYIQYICN